MNDGSGGRTWTLAGVLVRVVASLLVLVAALFVGVASVAGILSALFEPATPAVGWALAWGIVGLVTLGGVLGAMMVIWGRPRGAGERVARRK